MHHGENMAWLREAKKLRQKTLAGNMGVSQQLISEWEGSPTLSDDVFQRVAPALGVDPELIKNLNPENFINHINGEHNLVINYVVNYTINGLDKSATEQLLSSLQKLLNGK